MAKLCLIHKCIDIYVLLFLDNARPFTSISNHNLSLHQMQIQLVHHIIRLLMELPSDNQSADHETPIVHVIITPKISNDLP